MREFSRHVGGGVEALDFLEFLAPVKTCENDKNMLFFGDFWHPHFFFRFKPAIPDQPTPNFDCQAWRCPVTLGLRWVWGFSCATLGGPSCRPMNR